MKNSFLKTSLKEVKTVVTEDGEVLDYIENKQSYIANSKEAFFLGYATLLSTFKDISGQSIKVYAYLLKNYEPGLVIGVNKPVKEAIREWINSTASTTTSIDNSLAELVKNNLLIRREGSKGAYLLNPRYAFKGSTKDRDASLRTILTLECPTC